MGDGHENNIVFNMRRTNKAVTYMLNKLYEQCMYTTERMMHTHIAHATRVTWRDAQKTRTVRECARKVPPRRQGSKATWLSMAGYHASSPLYINESVATYQTDVELSTVVELAFTILYNSLQHLRPHIHVLHSACIRSTPPFTAALRRRRLLLHFVRPPQVRT